MPVPVFCCFSISVFPHIKSAPKIREKSDKKSVQKNLLEGPEWGQRATTRGPGALVVRPRGWPSQGAPGPLVAPLAAPLRLYILRDEKPSRTEPFFAISPLFRRRRASKIGSASRPLPGTLPEGGLTSGSFSTTMDASRMIREYSTLDHGSMISSYVMFSSPLCSSLIRPFELPFMIKAHM